MATQRTYQYNLNSGGNNKSPFNGLIGMLVGVLFIVGLFYLVRFVFNILWFILPVIIIATAVIDHKVIVDYAKWLGRLFKRNVLTGVVATALTGFGAPVVALFLLGKALFRKKINTVREEMEQQKQGEFVDYEEVDSETLDLPTLEQKTRAAEPRTRGNEYDDMFK